MHVPLPPGRPRHQIHSRESGGPPSSIQPSKRPLAPTTARLNTRKGASRCRFLPILALIFVLCTLAITIISPAVPRTEHSNTESPEPTPKDMLIAALNREGELSRGKEQCQTIVFFHVPKTGGESVNGLWYGNPQFGWERYRRLTLRQTALGIPSMNSMDVSDQTRFLETL